jgi:hypothetical protein
MYSRRERKPISTKSGTTAPRNGAFIAPSATSGRCGKPSALLQPIRNTVVPATISGPDTISIRSGHTFYLFYRLTTTGIDVVRILHQRMDFERHL